MRELMQSHPLYPTLLHRPPVNLEKRGSCSVQLATNHTAPAPAIKVLSDLGGELEQRRASLQSKSGIARWKAWASRRHAAATTPPPLALSLCAHLTTTRRSLSRTSCASLRSLRALLCPPEADALVRSPRSPVHAMAADDPT
jgi:hypothetical protein